MEGLAVNQQFGNQIGQRAFFGGAGNMNQGATGLMGGNMANQGNFSSGMSANFGNQNQGGFGQMGMSQGVSQQQLNQIHQNSIFNGASQPDNMQVQRIHQATISGEESNPLRVSGFGGTSMGMMGGAGFGGAGMGMGMSQGVSQQQLNQIHRNSIFNGASQPDNMQVQRIHQATISSEESNPLRGAGFSGTSMGMTGGAGSMGMMSSMGGNLANQGNFGSGMSANFGNQNQGGFGQMGMSQGVSQQQLNQIHQNSIFNGASQPDNMQVQRIHQATISSEESNPLRGAGFSGTSMGMTGGAGSMGMMSSMGGNLANQGNFGSGMSANFGNQNQGGFGQMGMGMSQGVPQQQLNQIHQNSIFNGASQPDNAQVQRIHQATISGEELNPLSNAFGGGFGGSRMGMGGMSRQGFVNPSALNAVLNADAGIRDQQGPNSYPASMFTGSNQFDNVNQSVLNQMTRSF